MDSRTHLSLGLVAFQRRLIVTQIEKKENTPFKNMGHLYYYEYAVGFHGTQITEESVWPCACQYFNTRLENVS